MSSIPVPCPTCDGARRVPGALAPSWSRECPVCKGAGLVQWAEKKVGAALAVDLEALASLVTGPLEYVRLARARLASDVAARVQRLGGDPRKSRHPSFRSRRQVATDWRDEDNVTRGNPAMVMFRYQAKYMVPEPYTGLVHREE